MSFADRMVPGAEWLPFLAELAAKSTLVLLLTALAAALLWRASAAARHLVWCVGVAGVLAVPAFAAVLPEWEVPLLPAAAATAAPAPSSPVELSGVPAIADLAAAEPLPIVSTAGGESARRPGDWLPLAAAGLAGGGVLLGLLWLAAGFWGVSRIGRRCDVVRDPEWLRAAQDAAALLEVRRPVLLLRSREAAMPATWGLLWPAVVLPASADEWPQERRMAVLAHELAHVKRFDCLTQALAQLACVLFWWHPAVWYAARRLRVERERACDDLVLRAGTRASDYAAHLLEVARAYRAAWLASPALVSMARPSHLESRLLSVLDGARARGVPSAATTLLVVLGGFLLVGPVSALRLAEAAPAGADAAASVAAEDAAGPPAPMLGAAAPAPAPASAAELASALPAPAPLPADTPPPGRRPGDAAVDELVGMRAVGVTPAYVAEMNAQGFGRLTAEQLTSLRALGVTPAYVAELRRAGYTGLTVDEVQGMKAVGVDAEYVRALAEAGYPRIPADEITGLRALGVTPAYVRELAGVGLRGIPLDELQGMRAMGVDAGFVREMRAAVPDRLGAEELVAMRALGVTPAYVRELAGVGLTGLTAQQLTDLRAHGVSAAYVRELREAGFSTALTADQIVRLRTSGIDRELMRSRGRSAPPRR